MAHVTVIFKRHAAKFLDLLFGTWARTINMKRWGFFSPWKKIPFGRKKCIPRIYDLLNSEWLIFATKLNFYCLYFHKYIEWVEWVSYALIFFSSFHGGHSDNNLSNPLSFSMVTELWQAPTCWAFDFPTYHLPLFYWILIRTMSYLPWPTFPIIRVMALQMSLWLIPSQLEITITVAQRRTKK